MENIPKELRCPASPLLIMAFMSSCTGSYSGAALSNYTAGLRAWHILHGQPWPFNEEQLRSTLIGASKLAPLASKRPKQELFTVSKLECILGKLDCNKLSDAAVAGCVMTIFYSCTAKFTQKTLNSFDPVMHVKPLDITHKID